MAETTSTEAELTALYPDWRASGLTWGAFGNCAEEDISGIKSLWFPDNAVRRGQIHDIWTRHPKKQAVRAAAASAGLTREDLMDVLKEYEAKKESETIVISGITQTKCETYFQSLKISTLVDPLPEDIIRNNNIRFEQFTWNSTESRDMQRAVPHLLQELSKFQIRFGSKDCYALYDVHSNNHSLSIANDKVGKISGGTDVILAPCGLALDSAVQKACVVFELKPSNWQSHEAQAKIELLAATIISDILVLAVLTDMRTGANAYTISGENEFTSYSNLSLTEMAWLVSHHLHTNCVPDRRYRLPKEPGEHANPAEKLLHGFKKPRTTPFEASIEYEHFQELLEMTEPATLERAQVVDQYFHSSSSSWRNMFV